MVAHFTHVYQRNITGSHQHTAGFAHKGQAVVRHIVLHACAGQLVHTGTEGFGALLQIQGLVLFQGKAQGQEHALDVRADGLAQLHAEINAGHSLKQLEEYTAMNGAGKGVLQLQNGKDVAPLFADDFFQLSRVQLGVLAADIPAQDPALLLFVTGELRKLNLDGGALIQRREEGSSSCGQHIFAGGLVDKPGNTLLRTIGQVEPAVLKLIRQTVGHGVIVVDNVPNTLGAHISVAAVEGLRQGRQLLKGIVLLFSRSKGIQEGNPASSGMRGNLAGQLLAVLTGNPGTGQIRALNIEFHGLQAGNLVGGADPQLAVGVVIPHDVPFFLGNEAQHHGSAFVGLGSVAVLAHIQVQHHGVIGTGNGGGMAPGVLRIEEQVVFCRAAQSGIVLFQLFIQAMAQGIAALGFLIVLHRIRRGACAVGPPVGEVAVVHRAVLELVPDSFIQLLEGDHADFHGVAVTSVEALNGAENLRLRRCVVAEHAGHAGHNKVIAVAVLLAEGQVVLYILMELVYVVHLGGNLAEQVLGHEIGGAVGLYSQGVAQIVVFAVPHQQALAFCILPPVGVLVLIEGIHAVVAVDIGVEELNAMGEHSVPLAHGDAVDVRDHGCGRMHAVFLQKLAHFIHAAAENLIVHQIAEVEIGGGKADTPFPHETEEGFFFFRGGDFQEFLHAEPGLAVPAEILIFRLLHNLEHRADVVGLVVDDVLLQIRVANIGVGVMNDVQGFDLVFHGTSSKKKIDSIK